MSIQRFPVYKGLQKPLMYRGFKGKFIGYGVGCLMTGLVLGGLFGSLTNMFLGGSIMVATIVGGLFLTASLQKKGLHSKIRHTGVFIHPVKLTLRYGKK